MRDMIKGSLTVSCFRIAGAFSLFFFELIVARHYGPTTLGALTLFLNLLILSAIFSKFGIDIYIVKMIPALEPDSNKIGAFLKKSLSIVLTLSLITASMFIALSSLIDRYLFKSFDAALYIRILSIVIIPFALVQVIPEIFRSFNNVALYSFFKNVFFNFNLLVAVYTALIFNLNINVYYLLFSLIVITALVLMLLTVKFLKKKNISLLSTGNYKDGILRYSYPMLLTSSMFFLMGKVDSFMISYYTSEKQVGIYTVCLKISMLITFVVTSINGYLAPKISKNYSLQDYNKLRRIYGDSLKIISIIAIPAFIVITLFNDFFLGIFGSDFIAGKTTLFLLNCTYLVNALFGSVGYFLNMTGNQKVFMKIVIFSAVANFSLNLVLIPIFQIEGAAIATLISTSLWNVSSFYFLKRSRIIG